MNVFTYGSLMFPQVWRRVVRGRYRAAAGSADDCRRYAIERETYPGTARLLDAPWEPDAFQLRQFLNTYCRDRLGGEDG